MTPSNAQARSTGYLDALSGKSCDRLAQHPQDRSAYRAGFLDGLDARKRRNPKRPDDQELRTLLMLAHCVIHQHVPLLRASHAALIGDVQQRLQTACESQSSAPALTTSRSSTTAPWSFFSP